MHCVRSVIAFVKHSQSKVIPIRRPVCINYIRQECQFSQSTAEDNTDDIINEICKNNPEKEKKLRVLMLEVEVMRQDGRCAPNTLNQRQWQELMELSSKNQRSNYLLYLFKTEKARENAKAKKEARRKEYEETKQIRKAKMYPDDIDYSITDQALFLRIRDQSINYFDNYRLIQAMIYGKSLVIDCSYEDHMVNREILNAAKQMTLTFGDNRVHKDPFNLHLCNVNVKGRFYEQLGINIRSLEEPWFPLNIHNESYMDLFPKEKLVYLTPHCRNELTHYNDEHVYIIGCMVDKVKSEPFSLAKAKRNGIKMAKLPLDRYLEWAPGSRKSLNINHMISILLDLKLTGDWEYSLKHVPRRKLMETKVLAMQKKIKNNPELEKKLFKSLQNIPELSTSRNRRQKRFKRSLVYDNESII